MRNYNIPDSDYSLDPELELYLMNIENLSISDELYLTARLKKLNEHLKEKEEEPFYFYITFKNKDTGEIETHRTNFITEKNANAVSIIIPYFDMLEEKAEEILKLGNIRDRYSISYIPKKNGKRRQIEKPDDILREYMRELLDVFSNKMNFLFPKNAFAYIKGRNTKQMAEIHKNSIEFLTFDIKDFFHSCSLQLILKSMSKVYPFCMIDPSVLRTILLPCMYRYNNRLVLPQGAPTSPMLSNIAMIPTDIKMQYVFKDFVYSRYSDDIIISKDRYEITDPRGRLWPKTKFLYKIFRENGFRINEDKTHSGSKYSGGFSMVGMYINPEGNITLGHKTKQVLKAMIWSFLADVKNGKKRTKKEVQKMAGKIGHYKYIEPDYVEMIIKKYEEKTGINYFKAVKDILNS